ncbi:unnamed protein product [Rotaria magnacalcarata]|uniref:Uncharacterized protein n=1 Tax=Rotaria magnacalcarata TaxID=392030 RepID=A0A819NT67_9BILA|nr:unnamed protein product [Rotaria magnacalcarata]CAF2070276.1 unnamed protein product [Rotaria magnacalcarata]CAF4001583.1 unnamed protein product [Rotaria magnacalcarata]CAF4200842.1 unnamed protein product [Rotaria magnacalcarata]
MALGNGLRIVWLDTHIGVMGKYQDLKKQFRAAAQPVASMPPGGINELICYIEENVAPIEFVSTIDDALALIQHETDKRIIWISSGTLGEQIIPKIVSEYPRVYFFYIFCGYVKRLVEWALDHEYENIMKIVDTESVLLVHLTRDMSNDIIKLGESYMELLDGKSAEKCFLTAQKLEQHANAVDSLHNCAPLLTRLSMLEGPNGLIQKARDLNGSQS